MMPEWNNLMILQRILHIALADFNNYHGKLFLPSSNNEKSDWKFHKTCVVKHVK
ncbi:hypothetical protein SAMN05421877_11287 [Sphingobacterium lactis]|uniref:Uncharacterized protein n=1 Tax=Sphingobacterium lactis TaxID=797291 RepID=A0A1H6C044_9SPHI|nr:hypothetical protein SAMN05421877_11287 [Sphingobacterium lactis]